jgi:hypothetical protein
MLTEKLCRETMRLDGDVRRLSARFDFPEADEEPVPYHYWSEPRTLREVVKLLEATRAIIERAERKINQTDSRIDQLISGGWGQEELAPYLKGRGNP